MVSSAQIESGISVYLEQNLLPLFPEGSVEKVMIGAGAAIFLRRNLPRIMKALEGLGLVDGAGMVDEDLLLEEVRKRVPDSGMKIEDIPFVKSMTLHKGDVDEIVRCVREAK